MSNLVVLPRRELHVSQIRARDVVIKLIVPKILGLIWERGAPSELPGSVHALINDDLVLGGFIIEQGAYGINAWFSSPDRKIKKVFSAHIGSHAMIDGAWPYWDGRCRILSWKRGDWEDQVVAEEAAPRTIAHVLHAGLSRQKHAGDRAAIEYFFRNSR